MYISLDSTGSFKYVIIAIHQKMNVIIDSHNMIVLFGLLSLVYLFGLTRITEPCSLLFCIPKFSVQVKHADLATCEAEKVGRCEIWWISNLWILFLTKTTGIDVYYGIISWRHLCCWRCLFQYKTMYIFLF